MPSKSRVPPTCKRKCTLEWCWLDISDILRNERLSVQLGHRHPLTSVHIHDDDWTSWRSSPSSYSRSPYSRVALSDHIWSSNHNLQSDPTEGWELGGSYQIWLEDDRIRPKNESWEDPIGGWPDSTGGWELGVSRFDRRMRVGRIRSKDDRIQSEDESWENSDLIRGWELGGTDRRTIGSDWRWIIFVIYFKIIFINYFKINNKSVKN